MGDVAPPGRFGSNAVIGMMIGSVISLFLWALIVGVVVQLI